MERNIKKHASSPREAVLALGEIYKAIGAIGLDQLEGEHDISLRITRVKTNDR